MPVNRRNALKQLVLVSAGAVLLPSCLNDSSRTFLEDLTSTIIPSGTTPGAREAGAHLFVLKMMNDCASKEDRDRFFRGLEQLEKNSRSTKDITALLTSLETKDHPDTDLSFCYQTIKRLTIQAYTTSRYYLTKVQVYELVPGRFHGCMPVKPQMNAAS